MTPRIAGLLVILLAGGATSCDLFSPVGCTLIGCGGGLTVEFAGEADESFTLTATSLDGQEASVTCSGAGPCRTVFEGFSGSEVTIVYQSASRRVERTFTPDYRRSWPNGEECPPECLDATVEFGLGAAG